MRILYCVLVVVGGHNYEIIALWKDFKRAVLSGGWVLIFRPCGLCCWVRCWRIREDCRLLLCPFHGIKRRADVGCPATSEFW